MFMNVCFGIIYRSKRTLKGNSLTTSSVVLFLRYVCRFLFEILLETYRVAFGLFGVYVLMSSVNFFFITGI